MSNFMEGKTVSEVIEALQHYDGDDIDDIKAYWNGAAARKFHSDLLKEWRVYDNDETADEMILLLEKRIMGEIRDKDLILDDNEYEKKMAFGTLEEKQRWMDARKFAKLKELYGPRLICTGEIVDSLRKYGTVLDDMNEGEEIPFWKTGKKNENPGAVGLSAMVPFVTHVKDPKSGDLIPIQCFGSDGTTVEIAVYGGHIFSGSLNIEEMFNKIQNRKDDMGILSLVAELCKMKFASEKTVQERKSAMLAAQQLAVQKFGIISITGGSSYLDDAFEVAARNGTWKYIGTIKCVSGKYRKEDNEKLQKRLVRTVLNAAGIDSLWAKISNKPLRGDISIEEAEREIRSCMTGFFAALRAVSPNNADANDLRNRYADLLNLREGYLIDKIIEMQSNEGGYRFADDMNRLIDLVKEKKEDEKLLDKIKEHAVEKAAMRNAIEDARQENITSPTAAILLESLGLTANSKPAEIMDAMKDMGRKIAQYIETPDFQERGKEYQSRVQKVANDISHIASDPLLEKMPGLVLAAGEAVSYKGKSLSAEIADIASDMREAGIDMQTQKVDFLSVMRDSAYADRERIEVREWTRSTPAQKNNEQHIIDGARYSMQTLDTAAGPVVFLKENMGPVPIAIAANGQIVSETKKTAYENELMGLAKASFKGVGTKGQTRTERQPREEQREDMEASMRL